MLRTDSIPQLPEVILEDNNIDALKGQFLIAMPGLADPNFAQTVTCMCEHTQEGSVGIIINRVHHALSAKDIFTELKIVYSPEVENLPVYFGGPVHMGEVFVLHGPPFDWKGSINITPTIALSNTRDIIWAIAEGKGPELFNITLGCAGWGVGQLESEIKQNAWLTCPVKDKIIFKTPVDLILETVLKMMGISDPILLSDKPGRA